MTEKELKKLNRYQLLELIILQTEQIAELEKQLSHTKEQLDAQQIQSSQAGSIADAAMQLSGIFKAAQKAADTYLENVKRHTDNADRIEAEATAAAEQLLEKARTEADSLTKNAKTEATTLVENAQTEATTLVENAQTEATTLVENARSDAERITTNAQQQADSLIQSAQTMLEETTRRCNEKEAAVNSYIANIREAFHLQFQNLDQIAQK